MLQATMPNDCVEVRKRTVENCLTCSLCSDLLTEATTICICLHTFCRECIYQKLEDDETNCCPVCHVYLGCCPEEKLRPDNNLQNIGTKVFPVMRSSKMETRVASRKLSMSKKVTKKNCNERDVKGVTRNLGSSSSHKGSFKFSTISKKQKISGKEEQYQVANTAVEPQTHEDCSFKMQEEGPEWEGLSVLAETANRVEDSNMALSGFPALNLKNNGNLHFKNSRSLKRSARALKPGQRNENENVEYNSVHVKRANPNSDGAVRINDTKEQSSNANRIPDNSFRRLYPVWFVLLACRDEYRIPYPQIPKSYIRIKDRNVPVTCIKKYLVQKLNLRHESEVEVMCCGEVAPLNATLNDLVDIWVRLGSNIDGSSLDVHNLVMVLTYRRK